ncbi:peptidoglycan DD-metalloendopeptidase family protein [bacterium]|nr:peptidoglycan DD-metalloendopeptidase family protein [bacterium]
MVDYYLNPLDTAPVSGSAPPIRTRVVAPQTASFSDLLNQASTQAASPMLKPNALLTPASGTEPLIQQTPASKSKSGDEDAQPPTESVEELKKQLADILPPISSPAHSTVSSVTRNAVEAPLNPAPGLEMNPAVNEKIWNVIYEPKQEPNVTTIPAEYVFEPAPQPEIETDDMTNISSAASITPPETVEPADEIEENWSPMESTYTVQQGDTLSQIVADTLRDQQIDFSTRDIYRLVGVMSNANEISNANVIYAGQKIDLSPIQEFVIARRDSDKAVAMNTDAQMPAYGPITSNYGMRLHPVDGEMRQHNGIDIGVSDGTPIKPIEAGTVVFSGEKSGYGNVVDVAHDDGLVSRYAHLSERLVQAGDQIGEGQLVGLSGHTGNATGPHLHLEVMQNGKPVNPLNFLPERSIAQK